MSLRVCVFCQCCYVQDLEDPPEWVLHFKVDGTVDRRRYNAPTTADVAGFMPGGCIHLKVHVQQHIVVGLSSMCSSMCRAKQHVQQQVGLNSMFSSKCKLPW
jgi:hypothetical protein